MMILTRRPGEAGFVAPEADHVARIDLQPLTLEQAEAVINSATSDQPLLPSQVAALAERAAGNPLFLVELMRSLKSGSDVDSLPHSVEGLIAARIDRLATERSPTLAAACGDGERVSPRAHRALLSQRSSPSPGSGRSGDSTISSP